MGGNLVAQVDDVVGHLERYALELHLYVIDSRLGLLGGQPCAIVLLQVGVVVGGSIGLQQLPLSCGGSFHHDVGVVRDRRTRHGGQREVVGVHYVCSADGAVAVNLPQIVLGLVLGVCLCGRSVFVMHILVVDRQDELVVLRTRHVEGAEGGGVVVVSDPELTLGWQLVHLFGHGCVGVEVGVGDEGTADDLGQHGVVATHRLHVGEVGIDGNVAILIYHVEDVLEGRHQRGLLGSDHFCTRIVGGHGDGVQVMYTVGRPCLHAERVDFVGLEARHQSHVAELVEHGHEGGTRDLQRVVADVLASGLHCGCLFQHQRAVACPHVANGIVGGREVAVAGVTAQSQTVGVEAVLAVGIVGGFNLFACTLAILTTIDVAHLHIDVGIMLHVPQLLGLGLIIEIGTAGSDAVGHRGSSVDGAGSGGVGDVVASIGHSHVVVLVDEVKQ